MNEKLSSRMLDINTNKQKTKQVIGTYLKSLRYFNRGVSHYRILPISRDIGWPVQQLDYFRYKAIYTDC